MVTKKEEINSTEAFTSILFNEEGKPDIFMQNCPHCHSADIKIATNMKLRRMESARSMLAKIVAHLSLRLMAAQSQA